MLDSAQYRCLISCTEADMKFIIAIIAVAFLAYAFFTNGNSTKTISDNYGQYDKGSPLCDKGAYGDVNGLCK